MKWCLIIQNEDCESRHIPLDHEYDTEREADSEAEKIADEEYQETDIAWTVTPCNKH